MSAAIEHDVTADVNLDGDVKQHEQHHDDGSGDQGLLEHDASIHQHHHHHQDPAITDAINEVYQHTTEEHQQQLQHQDETGDQEDLYHHDHQQYQDHQQHDTHHQQEPIEHEGAEGKLEQHEHDAEAAPAEATAFDFLPFFPNGAQDMNRFAEAWQQGQQQLQAQAAAAAAAAAAATQHHGQQLDQDGKLQHGELGTGELQDGQNGEHNGQIAEVGQDGKIEQGVDAGDAGLLLGMAAESNNQAAAQQQQVQNAIAAYSAASPNGGYGSQAAYGSDGTHNSARDAAAAAAAAAAASSGVNPAYAIAAALAAQSQRNGQTWDYAQLSSYANAAAAANPYSNPNYQANIAAYNQQQHPDDPSASDHTIPKTKVRGSRAPGTVPNTIGGHTHRPGSGHAFCSGPVVEGTNIKRFVFPCPPSVSSGRQKHVQSAQQMADTYPLAEHPCDRCTGYDNPLPCFHIPGNKCVYCKFLSKPCSLQPGGSNSKGIRRPGDSQDGKPKKKRKTDKDGYEEGEDPNDTMGAEGVDDQGEADASAYLEQNPEGYENQQHHQLDGVQQEQQEHQPQLGDEEQGHQLAQDLAAAAAAAQQQHEEQLQAQAAQAIQQAQAQQEEEEQQQQQQQQLQEQQQEERPGDGQQMEEPQHEEQQYEEGQQEHHQEQQAEGQEQEQQQELQEQEQEPEQEFVAQDLINEQPDQPEQVEQAEQVEQPEQQFLAEPLEQQE